MSTQCSVENFFIIPPPPGSMTELLTEDYLTSLITPPPPPSQFLQGSKGYSSDVDSDYHSVGGDSPTTPKNSKRTQRTSPVGASPSNKDEVFNRTNLPAAYSTDVRSRVSSTSTSTQESHSQRSLESNSQKSPESPAQRSSECTRSAAAKIPGRQPDLRSNKMYNSLNRLHATRNKRAGRRGSYDELLSQDRPSTPESRPMSSEGRPMSSESRPMYLESRPMYLEGKPMYPDNRPMSPDSRPMSPSDESTLLGNLGFEEEQPRTYRQDVNCDVHGAIDHFIRSENRYISDISSLLHVHIEPLLYQGCLNLDVVNSIKSSLMKLLHFHQSTCEDIDTFFSKSLSETREGEKPDYFTIVNYTCDTLAERRAGFKTYINFCCTRAQLIRNIGQMNDDETSRWEKYVEHCNPSGDQAHSLEAGLAMPIQRIKEYSSMVKDMQIRGNVRYGVLYEKLGRTATMLEGVTKAVENRVQMQQEFSSLYKNNHKHEVLIGPIEELLHYGSVVEVKSRDIENFVPDRADSGLLLLVYKKGAALVQRIKIKKKHSFNKLAVAQTSAPKEEYSLKKFYPVSCLQLKDLPNSLVFQLTDTLVSQHVILACRLLDAKAELVRNVADIISDYDKFLSSSLQMKDTV